MVSDFVVARNPDTDSRLPYLVRIPLGPEGIVLKTREVWPRTNKVFCHRAAEWPAEPEIVERVAVRSCVRRGPAIDLVLDRGRENRSQFVLAMARGREVIFWQSPRTTRQARPQVAIPTRRSSSGVLHILIDTAERYPYTFTRQQATTERRRLSAGDYAVEVDDAVVASVERKSLDDLAGSLISGKLTYALAELTSLARAAVVVEDRYSAIFKMQHTSGGAVAEALAEAQARFPQVPIMFAETRPLAQEWTYRFLGAALTELTAGADTSEWETTLVPAGPVPPAEPTAAEIRRWARQQDIDVPAKGRIPATVRRSYDRAHASGG